MSSTVSTVLRLETVETVGENFALAVTSMNRDVNEKPFPLYN